jgi:hypothetical protein
MHRMDSFLAATTNCPRWVGDWRSTFQRRRQSGFNQGFWWSWVSYAKIFSMSTDISVSHLLQFFFGSIWEELDPDYDFSEAENTDKLLKCSLNSVIFKEELRCRVHPVFRGETGIDLFRFVKAE